MTGKLVSGLALGAALAVVYAFGSQTSVAGTVYIGSGTTSGGSVDATATFTVKTGEIDVTLSNLGQNPTADSQLISALSFKVSGSNTSGSLTTTNSGDITTISSGGTYTAGELDSLTHWDASAASSVVTLTTLSGGKPSDLIIGPDSKGSFNPLGGGLYTNANSSILQHNPSVLGTATFAIMDVGITSSTTINDVVFQFGTTAGEADNLITGTAAVPEPASIISGAIGLICVGIFAARRSMRLKLAGCLWCNKVI